MSRARDDRGTILPLVLVVVVVMGAVIVALADYASSTLRYGQVVERSTERFAAAGGALDNALEAIDRRASPCILTPRVNDGIDVPIAPAINDTTTVVRCEGEDVTGVEELALVLTGDPGTGLRDGAMLRTRGASTPRRVVDGPVFIAGPPAGALDIQPPTVIRNGDLWYRDGSCGAPTPSYDPQLEIVSQGHDLRCIEGSSWKDLFQSARPSEQAVQHLLTAPPVAAPTSTGDCTVWPAGRYVDPPDLSMSDAHYFVSGDYYFENVDRWEIAGASVLFGWPGAAGPGLPIDECLDAWFGDGQTGATLFLGGDSRIELGHNGSLELSGRIQAGRSVSLHALEDVGTPSTIQGDTPPGFTSITRLVEAQDDFQEERVAIHGLVWAPYASLGVDSVANRAVPVLAGGAVAGEVHLGVDPNATDTTNLLASSGSTPAPRRLRITATATSTNGGSTTAEAIVRYSNGDHALESRRVLCLTPDDPACGP